MTNKEWMARYRKTEKGKIANSKACKKWRENHPDYIPAYKKECKNDPEKIREYNKKYREKNCEKVKEYRKNNREKQNECNRKYYKTEKGKAANQRNHTTRRIKMKEIINTLTAKEWEDILEKYNYRCFYCGVEFNCENSPTRDHVIPISKDGNNTKDNIVPACQSCNSRKGDNTNIG